MSLDHTTIQTTTAPDPSAGHCSTEDYRDLMCSFPTGVSVVTAADEDGRPWGLTCSSLSSVTLAPPTLLVCLASRSPVLAVARASGRFAVNLLHARAHATAACAPLKLTRKSRREPHIRCGAPFPTPEKMEKMVENGEKWSEMAFAAFSERGSRA